MTTKPDMTAHPCALLGGPDCGKEIHAPDFVQATVRPGGHIYVRREGRDSEGRPVFVSQDLTAAQRRVR
ncbi:MAG: hypothetical protein JWM59_2449 [Verrucomicrobiales bacterium]|nr:hypothetical protein [Verrucomicrobiales bacterium]